MTLEFEGPVWRHVPAGSHALDFEHLLKAGGRWNRAGQYGALYTALTPTAAVAEYRKHFIRRGITRPRDLVSVRVSIHPILDIVACVESSEKSIDSPLTDGVVGLPALDLAFLRGDRPKDVERCRAAADWARSHGFIGLLVPSAPLKGAVNLVIYPENRPRQLSLKGTSVRVPLNYGDAPYLDDRGNPTREMP